MLKLYRRHLSECPNRKKGRQVRNCKLKCPIWVQGTIEGRQIRKSLNITSWSRATEVARDMELGRSESSRITLADAIEQYTADLKARKRKEATLSKYKVLFTRLTEFCDQKGVVLVRDIDLPLLRKFRESWPDNALSASKKLERLSAFFSFCKVSKWLPDNENPVEHIGKPTVEETPTLPFTGDEWSRILAATYDYPDNYGRKNQENAIRLRSFVLALRWSGMRIGDTVMLKRQSLHQGRLLLRTSKGTGVQIWVPLPPDVAETIAATPSSNHTYFFWSGESNPKSAVGDWQRSLRKLFKLANVDNAHAHRFRDTFAVSLLEKGVSIEDVATLLGHKDIKVTQKHYAPWVRSRQELLEQAVQKTWQPRLELVKSS